jgi:hypothetical protein
MEYLFIAAAFVLPLLIALILVGERTGAGLADAKAEVERIAREHGLDGR